MKLFKRKKECVQPNPAEFKCDQKTVESMDRKTYLKYYISVLEKQIKEASKILKLKKKELKELKS